VTQWQAAGVGMSPLHARSFQLAAWRV